MDCSILGKCGKMWKNCHFPGQIRPDSLESGWGGYSSKKCPGVCCETENRRNLKDALNQKGYP